MCGSREPSLRMFQNRPWSIWMWSRVALSWLGAGRSKSAVNSGVHLDTTRRQTWNRTWNESFCSTSHEGKCKKTRESQGFQISLSAWFGYQIPHRAAHCCLNHSFLDLWSSVYCFNSAPCFAGNGQKFLLLCVNTELCLVASKQSRWGYKAGCV